MSINARIASLREARGLTQKDLAGIMKPKTSSVQISRLETDSRRLTVSWLLRFARALNVTVSDFLPDEEYAPRDLAVTGADGIRIVTCKLTPGDPLPSHPQDIIRLARIGLRYLELRREAESLETAPPPQITNPENITPDNLPFRLTKEPA